MLIMLYNFRVQRKVFSYRRLIQEKRIMSKSIVVK